MGNLNKGQKLTMYRMGFLLSEIRAFDNAVNPTTRVPQKNIYNTKPFKAMMRSRLKYIKDLSDIGLNKAQIAAEINRYYTSPASSPFDLIKLEYKPIDRPLPTAAKTAKTIIRSRVTRKLGKAYGARMNSPVKIPLFVEPPPNFPKRITDQGIKKPPVQPKPLYIKKRTGVKPYKPASKKTAFKPKRQ